MLKQETSRLKKTSGDSTVEAIDVTSGQVTGTGTTTITVNPSSNLANGTSYYVQIDATAFDDTSGNSYAGISDSTTLNFTTISAPSTSSIERIVLPKAEIEVEERFSCEHPNRIAVMFSNVENTAAY